jgi:hypothetical protein
MEVYVLYDCVENPDEWAFAGVEHVYMNHDKAMERMLELYNECLAAHKSDDTDSLNDTYIWEWGARVADVPAGYRHTWTITKEEVVK